MYSSEVVVDQSLQGAKMRLLTHQTNHVAQPRTKSMDSASNKIAPNACMLICGSHCVCEIHIISPPVICVDVVNRDYEDGLLIFWDARWRPLHIPHARTGPL